jgi:hypothetical protein
MATRYWRGGNGTWNTSSTTNWSTSSGGSGGASVPTASDDVVFDANSSVSTYSVTLTGALTCQSLTVAAPTSSTLTFTSTGTIAVSGSLSIAATGVTWSGTGTMTFNATSPQTINTNGVALACSVTLNGSGGSWSLASALTIATGKTFTLSAGGFSQGGYTLTCGVLSVTGSTTGRTWSTSGGEIYLSGSGTILSWTATNVTVTGTLSLNVSNTSVSAARTLSMAGLGGGLNKASVTINGGSGTVTVPLLSGAYQNFKCTPPFSGALAFSGSGQLSFDGDVDISFGSFASGLAPTALTFGTGGHSPNKIKLNPTNQFSGLSVSCNVSNAELQSDVLFGSGVALGGSTLNLAGYAFDCSTSVSVYSTTITSSGGRIGVTNTSGGGIITVDDAVTATDDLNLLFTTFNSSSGSLTYTATLGTGITRYNVTFKASSLHTLALTGSSAPTVKSLVLQAFSSGHQPKASGSFYVSQTMTFAGNTHSSLSLTAAPGSGGTCTITSAGASGFNLAVAGAGTTTLADTLSTNTLTHTLGTFDTGNQAVSCATFATTGSSTRVLTLGTSVCTVTGASWTASGSGLTVNPGSSNVTMSSASAKTFAGGGYTWGTLTQAGAGALTVTGSNTFANIANTVQPCTVKFTAGTTNSFNNFSLGGVLGSMVTITSATSAQHTLTKLGGGQVQVGYCAISYSNATPSSTWYAAP